MIKLKVERVRRTNDATNPLPAYVHKGDAGLDLRAAEDTLLKSGERKPVPTGVKVAIPPGYVGLIKDRSGLAAKSGIHTLAGVVDSGYRGEVGVVLYNTSGEDFSVSCGHRIAQLLILPVAEVEVEEADLDTTERGGKGWGSSGR